jgi:predicted lipoprotein with Yx(FWY)xxD motif
MRRVLGMGAAIVVLATSCGHPAAQVHSGQVSMGPTVTVTTVQSLGPVLVDARGRTLYLFSADLANMPTCQSACAAAWPPLLAEARPEAANGTNPALLRVARRPDGSVQVSYNGHPLYYSAADRWAGEARGQGQVSFGGAWWAVAPSGNAAAAQAG